MILLVLIGLKYDLSNVPFIGVQIISNTPRWGIIFFLYIVSLFTIFTSIPIITISIKLYYRLETKELKRKWLFFIIGFLGVISNLYLMSVYNLLDPVKYVSIRNTLSVITISLLLWGYFIYIGIGISI